MDVQHWNQAKRLQLKLLRNESDPEILAQMWSLFEFYNRVHDVCWEIEEGKMSKEEILNWLKAMRTSDPLELFT